MTAVGVAMTISSLHTRPMWLYSVLSGGAGVVLILAAAASPPAMADTSAQAGVVAGAAAAGSWGPPTEVAAALNTGGTAAVNSISCASAGNCGAGGYYENSPGVVQSFVVSEANGTWAPAIEVAAALNTLGVGEISSVSCRSAGNCTAGGYYSNSRVQGPFVVSEVNGTWGPAKAVATALNTGGSGRIESVSCASAGNCSAGGGYTDSSGHSQAFVVSQT